MAIMFQAAASLQSAFNEFKIQAPNGLFHRIKAAMVRARQARRNHDALAGIDDHVLRDIGYMRTMSTHRIVCA